MIFGTTGRLRTAGFLILLSLVAGAVMAQDPEVESCELPLVVPDVETVNIELEATQRGPGVLISWTEPDKASSTCYALTDTADIGISMSVEGVYADQFDRTLIFEFTDNGVVGAQDQNRFLCLWNNANTTRTGQVGGTINLSNSGGLWSLDSEGTWSQSNEGFPFYLPYTNLISLDEADNGDRLVALTAGSNYANQPRGVYVTTSGGTWAEIGQDVFGTSNSVSLVAVNPSNSSQFAVGTVVNGVYVTNDGGATFTQWTNNLAPGIEPPGSYETTAMNWDASGLYVAVANFGIFKSTNGGASFSHLANLLVGDDLIPKTQAIEVDPSNSQRILFGLRDPGVYESTDGGDSWAVISVGLDPDVENNKILSIAIDPSDPGHLTVGTEAQSIWVTDDNGASWLRAVTPFDDPIDYPILPQIPSIIYHGTTIVAIADGFGIIETADLGANWTAVGNVPFNTNCRQLLSSSAGLLMPSWGGGIFRPGASVNLEETYSTNQTSPEYMDLELGLSLLINEGEVILQDTNGDGSLNPKYFNLVCQNYQGWIVWRSSPAAPDTMAMLGRFDKDNPETCIEGYCGDDNYVILPNCFSERRAACFQFGEDGAVSFYDDNVFNGFSYLYSVTTYDYGDISLVESPGALASPMVFPARYPGDPYAIVDGPGNRQGYQVNNLATDQYDGEEIYVYPNPLRRGFGVAGNEGEQVIWTNLPPDSKVEVFTLAGDHIVNLPKDNEPQEGGNIYWITRNDDNQLLASGVYMWRVVMPARGDFWGKLVIIR